MHYNIELKNPISWHKRREKAKCKEVIYSSTKDMVRYSTATDRIMTGTAETRNGITVYAMQASKERRGKLYGFVGGQIFFFFHSFSSQKVTAFWHLLSIQFPHRETKEQRKTDRKQVYKLFFTKTIDPSAKLKKREKERNGKHSKVGDPRGSFFFS